MAAKPLLTTLLEKRFNGEDLTRDEARSAITALLQGESQDSQIAAFLTLLAVKGETLDEITGAAEAMRSLSARVPAERDHLVDTCGTGGSGRYKLFNVSTAAAFVASAAGARVAKHGNRAATSKSGSADVLEAAGVSLKLSAQQVGRCINEIGVGFMFAPAHHSAMRHVGPIRKSLPYRTLFNVLGPLTNPADAPNQVIGVFAPRWQQPLAEALARLGSEHVLIVHSNGLDELAIDGPSKVVELHAGEIREYNLTPQSVGLEEQSHDELAAADVQSSLKLVRDGISNTDSAAGQIVALNAGATLYAAGVTHSIKLGVELAQDAQASGLGREKLDHLMRISSLMADSNEAESEQGESGKEGAQS